MFPIFLIIFRLVCSCYLILQSLALGLLLALSWALCPCNKVLALAGKLPPFALVLIPSPPLPSPPLPSPNSPFPSLPFQSFPLPFAALSRFLYPALFLLSSPLPCPLPFLPLSLSLCLSVTLSVCRSVPLSLSLSFSLPLCLLSLTSAFHRACWFPSVSRFVSFPLSLSLSLALPLCFSLCHPLFLSRYFCLMSLYDFVPSALDPMRSPFRDVKKAPPVVCLMSLCSFVLSALDPQVRPKP